MNNDLAIQFAKRFVQRRDVKAVQFPEVNGQRGGYVPDHKLRHLGNHGPLGFTMEHLHAHLSSTATYGHYLLDSDDNCRMFCLDIDLEKTGHYVPFPPWDGSMTEEQWEKEIAPIPLGDPDDPKDNSLRLAWLNRAHPARPWLKYQMGMLARKFCGIIARELSIGTAAAYSGNKGIHVYGFTGPVPAEQAREAALFVLDLAGDWSPYRGQHIFKHALESPELGYQNFSLEVYPKQSTLDGKDLGNLLRLPLGRNLKSEDPTFFLDLTTPPAVMQPHGNPVQLLETGDPFS